MADDHPDILERVTTLLEPLCEIVGKAGDGGSLVEAATQLKPEVIVTDISMPVFSGIEAINRLNESGSMAKVVFLTIHSDIDFVRASLATGAFGYVVKSRISTDLMRAIQEALAGRIFISPSKRVQE